MPVSFLILVSTRENSDFARFDKLQHRAGFLSLGMSFAIGKAFHILKGIDATVSTELDSLVDELACY